MKRTFALLICLSSLSACVSNIEHRGYLARPGSYNQIQQGMSKSEVKSILGTPSTTAGINADGDSYYYISSVTSQSAFFTPKDTNREIMAIRFNREGRVDGFGHYGLEDGHIIDVNTRESPTNGREYTFLQQLFGLMKSPGAGALAKSIGGGQSGGSPRMPK